MSITNNSRIIGLKVRNVKRLEAVDFTPDPGEAIIGVGGKNASGKTSLLDSIMYALAGVKSIPDDVIRKGAKKGEVVVELDDYIITRTITDKTSRLEIKGRDGRAYASPQTLLDEMTGSLTFDPLRFQRLSESPAGRREQADILRQLVGLDFRTIDEKRKNIYNRRQDVNRDLKSVTTQLDALSHYPDLPDEETSMSELSKRLQEAVRQNRENYEKRAELKRLRDHADETERKIEELQEELARLRTKIAAQQTIVDGQRDADEEQIRSQMANAEQQNQKIRKNEERKKLLQRQTTLQSQANALTEEINGIDHDKARQLANVKMPVAGLTFTEDAVLYNGALFENCSSAEQLRVSVAIGIAMNPKLRIMLIRDGSLLDKDSRRVLKLMAEQAELQAWVEFVGSDEACSIVIENGLTKGAAAASEGDEDDCPF